MNGKLILSAVVLACIGMVTVVVVREAPAPASAGPKAAITTRPEQSASAVVPPTAEQVPAPLPPPVASVDEQAPEMPAVAPAPDPDRPSETYLHSRRDDGQHAE